MGQRRAVMKFERKDMLDLNEENVKKVFNYCLANKETKDPFKAEFLEETQNMKLPNIFMSRQKINEKVWTVIYLLCQFAAIHEHTPLLHLLDGYRKYDGTNWTENKGTLFMLYYLAASTRAFPLFRLYAPKNTYVSPIHRQLTICGQPILKPTLSPADPDFPDWLKKNGLEQA